VAQRTREIGIGIALGAQKGNVLKITVGERLRLVLTGVVIGLAAALILTRVMSSLLFGVSANDPITFITISLILVSVAVLAQLRAGASCDTSRSDVRVALPIMRPRARWVEMLKS
jgi:putative ABC transport system permease protein